MLEDFEPASRPRRKARPAGVLGPILTAAWLLGTLGASVAMRPKVADVGPYFERVAERIRAMPYTLGTWVGRDEQVVATARELLKPNEILQRRYTRLEDGQWFDVIVVHCGDVRDMEGHFPPVCYKAAGWDVGPGLPATAQIGAQGIPATEYRVTYRHSRAVGPMSIVNFFAMPGEGVQYARDMGALNEVARSSAKAQLGVVQVQVLTPVSMDVATRRELMPAVWGMLEPVIREVVEGPDADV
jgi:hypothetical protein